MPCTFTGLFFLFFGLVLKGEVLQSVEHEQAEGLKRRRIRFGACAEKPENSRTRSPTCG